MTHTTFFEIPVYRIPEAQYYRERSEYVDKALYPGSPEQQTEMRTYHAENPDRKLYMEGLFEETYGGPWVYNEIIGFIRLHFLGRQIRGEYFDTKPRRKVKTRKKQFVYRTWKLAPEQNIPPQSNNQEIFKIICRYLENCRKEVPRRYIDSSHLEIIGPHVNWCGLLNGQ